MKKSLLQFSVCILMGVILLLAGPATAAKAADVEAFKAAVEDTWDKYSIAMNAENPDLWISLWDENGIQMPPGAPAVVGKPAIEKGIHESYQALDWEEFTIYLEEVKVAGDWGFARGTYSASITPKAGGETAFLDGKYLTIFKRQPDGSWKIFRDCFNSNVPPS
ncbi:hypothetical protein ES707_11219 [subsurface metagenome]